MEQRREKLMAFLETERAAAFPASVLSKKTGVAKKFVQRALAGFALRVRVHGDRRPHYMLPA